MSTQPHLETPSEQADGLDESSEDIDYVALLEQHDTRTLDVRAARRDDESARVVFDRAHRALHIITTGAPPGDPSHAAG